MESPVTLARTALLTAADCNAQFEMPLSTLAQIIVEVATDHANALGVGYTRLHEDGHSWVMLRLAIVMRRMPRVHETYTIETWVQSFNRRYSERDFEVSVGDGDAREVLGHVRTIWGVIDSTTRQGATLDGLERLEQVMSPRDTDFGRSLRLRPADFDTPEALNMPYRVVVSDIDTNRHLTAARYIELMLDMWPLEKFDTHTIGRFELAYNLEARFGDTLSVDRVDLPDGISGCRITRAGDTLASATLSFALRN